MSISDSIHVHISVFVKSYGVSADKVVSEVEAIVRRVFSGYLEDADRETIGEIEAIRIREGL